MSAIACCGAPTAPCCADASPLDSRRRVGCVERQVWICDECGATLTLSQVHAAFGLHVTATRSALCEADVTLNGRPARISGARHDFATVRDRETGLSCEWAWQTVARIVASGGEFKS